ISGLNGWPAGSPVNASSRTSRCATHDSGPVWFAIPSLLETSLFTLCRSPGAQAYFIFRFVWSGAGSCLGAWLRFLVSLTHGIDRRTTHRSRKLTTHPRTLVRGAAQSPEVDEIAFLLQPIEETRRYGGSTGKLIQL